MSQVPVSEQEALGALNLNERLAIQEVEGNLGFRPLDSDGCALSLYRMAIHSSGPFPNILVDQYGKRLQPDSCPPSFSYLFGRWADLVPAIQQLPQQNRHELQRAICGRLHPFPQTPYETNPFSQSHTSSIGVHGIANSIAQLANDINGWRSYRARQAYHTHTLPNYNMNFPTATPPPPMHSQTIQFGSAAPLRHPYTQPLPNLYTSYPHSASPPNILSESPSNEAFAPGVGGFNVTPHTPTFPLPSHSRAGTAQILEFPNAQPAGLPSSPFMGNQYQYPYNTAPPPNYQAPNLQIPVAPSLGDRTPTRSPFQSNDIGPCPFSPVNVDHAAKDIADVISSQSSISDIIMRLGRHGCVDLSERLNLSMCSKAVEKRGGYSDIYMGMLHDGTPVAIKTIFLRGQNDEERKHLKRTARELYTWSKCEHRHIAPLLGLAEYRGQIAMVSLWMQHGHVRDYVKKHPEADRLSLCIGIASALEYLHEKGVVHGDLKGPNVLVSDEGHTMLIDFGNTILGDSTLLFTATAASGAMTLRWTAPEMFDNGTHSPEGDVYALGMTILEIFTGEEPYHGKNEMAAIRAVTSSETPERPNQISMYTVWCDELWQLLMRCWEKNPLNRPTASNVHIELQRIQQIARVPFLPVNW